jgi:hypothetical protein
MREYVADPAYKSGGFVKRDSPAALQKVPESFALDVFECKIGASFFWNRNYFGNPRMIKFANQRCLAGQASRRGAAITKFGVRNLQDYNLSGLDIERFKDGRHTGSLDEFKNLKPVVKKFGYLEFAAQGVETTRFGIKKSLRCALILADY